MSRFIFEVQGLHELSAYFKSAPQATVKELDRATKRSALLVQRTERQEAPVDRGRLRSSIGISFMPFGARVEPSVKYAQDVHDGRPPRSRLAPGEAQNILAWARRKGLPGYAVLQTIKRKGTKPNRFVERTYFMTSRGVQNYFDIAIDNVVDRSVR